MPQHNLFSIIFLFSPCTSYQFHPIHKGNTWLNIYNTAVIGIMVENCKRSHIENMKQSMYRHALFEAGRKLDSLYVSDVTAMIIL